MKRYICLSIVAILVLAGCESMPSFNKSQGSGLPEAGSDPLSAPGTGTYEAPSIQPPGLALSAEQRFDDVPLPVGVEEDLDRSYVYESASLQIGRMVYNTRAGMTELIQFYLQECPAANWKTESVIQAEDTELVFTKPGKRLRVIIRKQNMGRRQLVLNLTPAD